MLYGLYVTINDICQLYLRPVLFTKKTLKGIF